MKKNAAEQIKTKVWILLSLAMGFFATIIIPRLAIERIGEKSYGIYAFIIGFSAILGFADLGLIPGLTKVLSGPIADGNLALVRIVEERVKRIVLIGVAVLCAVCILIKEITLPEVKSEVNYLILVFSLSFYFSTMMEVRLSLLRLSGLIKFTYQIRIAFLLLYLLCVVVLYVMFPVWSGLHLIFIMQFLSVILCFLIVTKKLRRVEEKYNKILPDSILADHKKPSSPIREIWHFSAPERLNKILQFAVGVVERPMIVAVGGLVLVGSFDLMMRLMLIVSAVPGALNQPLLSMLSHDLARNVRQQKFPLALRFTRVVSYTTAAIGLFIAVALFVNFHERIFGVPSIIPLGIFFLVAISTAVNVLTATASAVFISQGIIWPSYCKVAIEGVGIITGLIMGLVFNNAYLFLIFRYIFLLFSAIFFLIVEKKMGVQT